MKMKTPSRNYFLVGAAFVLLSICGHLAVYTHAKSSYREVGFIDGTIVAKSALVEKLERQGLIGNCSRDNPSAARVEFISVKAESIVVERLPASNAVRFCRL
jgi:hypothetical protein